MIATLLTFLTPTSNAVLYQGGKSKFVDIEKNSLNIDVNLIEECITEKTKAIMPVDFRNNPATFQKLKK